MSAKNRDNKYCGRVQRGWEDCEFKFVFLLDARDFVF